MLIEAGRQPLSRIIPVPGNFPFLVVNTSPSLFKQYFAAVLCHRWTVLEIGKNLVLLNAACGLNLTLFWVKSRCDPLISGMQLIDLGLVCARLKYQGKFIYAHGISCVPYVREQWWLVVFWRYCWYYYFPSLKLQWFGVFPALLCLTVIDSMV